MTEAANQTEQNLTPTQGHGFAFILSSIRVEADLPFELAPKYYLMRATTKQIEHIKSFLQGLRGDMPYYPPYEFDIQRVPMPNSSAVSYPRTSLPPEEWRYYVVEFKGNGAELQNIQRAALVIPNEIRFGCHFFELGSRVAGPGWHPQSLFTYLCSLDPDRDIARTISPGDLNLVSEVCSLLKGIPKNDYPTRAFTRFYDLLSIPEHSELFVIGLFSIIESLLTHKPGRPELGDSLTHQIQTKMPLVNKHHFPKPLNYAPAFGIDSEDSIWKKLYAYRSGIVHGDHRGFGDGTLSDAKEAAIVDLLTETAKQLLIVTLREPELMADLKKC